MHLPCYEILVPVRGMSFLYHKHALDGFQVSFPLHGRFLDARLVLKGSRQMSWRWQIWRTRRSNGRCVRYNLCLLLEEACILRLQLLKPLTIL